MSADKTLLEQLVEERVSPVQRHLARRQLQLAIQIENVLEEKGMTQRDLAKVADKKEPYISRLLAGDANPTMKTVGELEVALETDLLITPWKYEDQKKHRLLEEAQRAIRVRTSAADVDVSDEGNWAWHKGQQEVKTSSSSPTSVTSSSA